MKELEFIKTMAAAAGRAPSQGNACFECDAELFDLDGVRCAVTTDEFSPEEDHFSSLDPRTLGANLVVATVSDLLAAGARPRFLVHACTLAREADDGFARGLAEGIAEGLRESQCHLLGGDTGFGATWRYTATAIGTVERPLMRSGARPGTTLYSTGRFGSGNRQALLVHQLRANPSLATRERVALASPRFPSRRRAAEIVWRHASFAMDSSDGLIETARTLASVNPGCRFRVALGRGLLDPVSAAVAARAGLPPELLFFASAGEYEIVFGVPEESREVLEREMLEAGHELFRVGEVEAGEGVSVLLEDGRQAALPEEGPDPRAMPVDGYIAELAREYASLLARAA